MNRPVFQRSDFTLCEVPVPAGYPQSQTHVGIAYCEGKYYMTTSPYPNRHYGKYENYFRILLRKVSRGRLCNPIRADFYENPCIYVEDDNRKGVPSKFRLLSHHPLVNCPDNYYGLPAYNSDPDLYVEGDNAYILNRSVFPLSNDHSTPDNPYPAIVRLFLIKGQLKMGHFIFESINLIKEWDRPFASPCMTKYRDKYVLFYIDSNCANDGKSFNGIYVGYSVSPKSFANSMDFYKVKYDDSTILPWHMSLFHYNDRLYTVLSCVEKGNKDKIWLMLGEFSEDLMTLSLLSHPLTDYNTYRSSAIVDDKGSFILYAATLHEKVKGSYSVDGRDILVASKPIHEVLR